MSGTGVEIIGEADDRPVGLRLTYHPPLVHFTAHTTARGDCVASAQIDTRRGPVRVTAQVPPEFGRMVAAGMRRILAQLRGLPLHHPRVSRDLQTAATMLAKNGDATAGGFFGDLVAGTVGTLAGVATALIPGVGPLAAPVVGAAVGKLVSRATDATASKSTAPNAAPRAHVSERTKHQIAVRSAQRRAKLAKLRQRLASLPPAQQEQAIRIREASANAVHRLGAKIAAAHALAEMKRQAVQLAKDPQIARAVGLETIVIPGPGSAAVALRRAVRLQGLVSKGDRKAVRSLARLRKQAAAGHDASRRALWILEVVKNAPKL